MKKGAVPGLDRTARGAGTDGANLGSGMGSLANPETGDRINSPFFRGFVVWILLFFIATGYAYGRICRHYAD